MIFQAEFTGPNGQGISFIDCPTEVHARENFAWDFPDNELVKLKQIDEEPVKFPYQDIGDV